MFAGARWWFIDQRGMTGDPQFDVAIAAVPFNDVERRALVKAAGADLAALDVSERIGRAARL
ncbi:hypothetical protein E3T61_03175 [Cryobacterium lactosi]|uniref:Uncharacterized protein n=1 Tax=Cryobacterium lactosi TaxID=1259202 RepID=A0A4V3IXZ0_9MICO|nr:hypothetical protein [Cryobacterium lactosi]TFD94014.1 hypothetical protein E3T61_03175 [Cryobacterium lactosi]